MWSVLSSVSVIEQYQESGVSVKGPTVDENIEKGEDSHDKNQASAHNYKLMNFLLVSDD